MLWPRLTGSEVGGEELLAAEELADGVGEGPEYVHVSGQMEGREVTEGGQE